MENVKDIAKWLKEEVEFLENNEDYNGSWLELDNGLGICVYWADGFGEEKRDDIIQSEEQPDWALVVGVKLIDSNDQSAGGPYYWNFPYFEETGEVATEDVSVHPEENYGKLAQWLLDSYNAVKDLDIGEHGEIKSSKEENVEESLNTNPYKQIIAEYFEYDGDFDFLELVSDIIDRIDDFNDEDDISYAIDSGLTYYSDQWKVLQHYCNPQDANWDTALEYFMGDIYGLASKIAESNKAEEDE